MEREDIVRKGHETITVVRLTSKELGVIIGVLHDSEETVEARYGERALKNVRAIKDGLSTPNIVKTEKPPKKAKSWRVPEGGL